MNSIGTVRAFFGALLGIFFFNWIAFVVFPWTELGHLPPIQNEGDTDIEPFDSSGLAHQGERVYAANGCVYCHTQQVRPATSGADLVRGWGTAKSADNKEVTRRSFPRDYIWQGQTFLGDNREGADLSNVGTRYADAGQLYSYLYHPEVADAHSSMPAYRFLFVTRKISGQPSQEAVTLPPGEGAPAGFEVVPTDRARALVAYLLSLKKSYPLKPDAEGIKYEPPSETKS